MKQLSFLPVLKISTSLAHGGGTRKGKRKIARPFDPRRPMHVVLRSSRAKGAWSMLKPRHRDAIERLLRISAIAYQIQIHRFANVGNHLHILISAKSRKDFQNFLRRFAGAVASAITNASKSNSPGRFWEELAYSRVVSRGREFVTVMRYLVKNMFEAAGYWNRKQRPDEFVLVWFDGG